MCCILCNNEAARSVPTNYILYLTFVVCESWMGSYIANRYPFNIVMMAAVMTAFMSLALTVFALTTSVDFTGMNFFFGFLYVFGFGCLGFWFCMHFLMREGLTYMHTGYGLFGVVIGGIYIIWDTQLIMGGKQYSLSIDDYIVATLMI